MRKMKNFILISFVALSVNCFAIAPVTNNLKEAKQKAKTEHKLILLKFSGSDWCIPCINIQKKVINTTEFQSFADQHLVLMEADFPRLKKNKLSPENQKINGQLAELYNKDGIFPEMVLMDENGKVLKHWEGLGVMDPIYFEQQIKPYLNN